MSDSVESAKRAAELNPLSPALQYDYVTALGHAGQFDSALQELNHAEQLWPGSSVLADARFRFHLRYGDPRLAVREDMRGSTMWSPRLVDAFLKARIAPTPANVDSAIREAEALMRQRPRAITLLAQALGTFKRDEQLLRLLLNRPGKVLASEIGEVLFHAPMRGFWRDPRAMQVARQLRLTDYWRESGNWPDFCFDPGLPYDCKAVVAKLGG